MQSTRTTVKRGRKRALDDIEVAKAIIDDNLMCHVAQIKGDSPTVTPTCHWRDGDRLYWHGHAKAHNVIGSTEQDVCINICKLDGLVLARSAFHHSVNYQSITLFGKPELITDKAEKEAQLRKFVDKISPDRWQQLRPITEQELMITSVASIPIQEFSIKVRNEGVNDDIQDLSWPVWAGVIPVTQRLHARVDDNRSPAPHSTDEVQLPNIFKRPIYGLTRA